MRCHERQRRHRERTGLRAAAAGGRLAPQRPDRRSLDRALARRAETEGVETDGVDTDGVETFGVETCGVETDGVEPTGVETGGTVTEGTVTDGTLADVVFTEGRVAASLVIDAHPSTAISISASKPPHANDRRPLEEDRTRCLSRWLLMTYGRR